MEQDADMLLARWSFDEGQGRYAEDKVRRVHDRISYVFHEPRDRPARDPTWRPGIRGQALLFDGYSTWVTCPAEAMPAPGPALTLSAWIAPASFEHGEGDHLSAIIDQHDSDACQGYLLGLFRHGTWSLQVGTGGEWLEIWATDRPVPRDRWSFIVATYDGRAGQMVLYLNGERVAERSVAAYQRIMPCPGDVLIGKNSHGACLEGVFSTNMFHGLIDEVRIYGRALVPAEVQAEYSAYLDTLTDSVLPAPDLRPDRHRYDGDPHRPQYHFMPPEHWMNEPHAPLHFRGQYHLFYQHNPHGPYWNHIHWGHAVSTDLVHWRDLPYALSPEQDTLDPDGCWSGSAIVDDMGIPVIFYSAGDNRRSPNQGVALARSTFQQDGDDDLTTWIKHPDLLVSQEPGVGRWGEFRDPFVWKDHDQWYMLVGSGIPGQGGAALVYVSPDLLHWTYRGPLYSGDVQMYPRTGDVWELPVLLPLGRSQKGSDRGSEKHLLIVNPWFAAPSPHYCKYIFYWIGAWDRESYRFTPDIVDPQVIDLGEHFIGPSATIDDQGRIVLCTITRDGLSPARQYELGWAHNAGLPVVLELRPDGRLGVEPIPELRSLRQEHLLSMREQSLEEANRALREIRGAMLELLIEFESGTATQYGLAVRRTADGREETLLLYDACDSSLQADRRRSSLDPAAETSLVGGSLDLCGEPLRLHTYLDHSMIETYANGLKSLTTRVYPTATDALGVQVWANGTLIVRSLEVWRLRSAYE